ncbi:5,10-methylene-tetrahydrofolate dehydrogenase/methenyl tetrahydrofolate cyclohydrolase [Arthrobacter sp. UYEF20]
MSDLSGRTTVVIGASLGLGRGMRPLQYQTEETFSVNSRRGTREELCCSTELGMRR